ncbi:hypothetical protein P8935_22975 [Telmatobacter sp. DSM 110680]|uniref:Uncharacterized protein n=1 Tax=Telmatobacter sp. DSM 110680 TaxID=3036704 RepID=A0AAU7DJB0_9BACT
MTYLTSRAWNLCDPLVTMQHRPLVPAVLTFHVAFLGDSQNTEPPPEQHELSRLLLHRLVLEAALKRVAELWIGAAQEPLQ